MHSNPHSTTTTPISRVVQARPFRPASPITTPDVPFTPSPWTHPTTTEAAQPTGFRQELWSASSLFTSPPRVCATPPSEAVRVSPLLRAPLPTVDGLSLPTPDVMSAANALLSSASNPSSLGSSLWVSSPATRMLPSSDPDCCSRASTPGVNSPSRSASPPWRGASRGSRTDVHELQRPSKRRRVTRTGDLGDCHAPDGTHRGEALHDSDRKEGHGRADSTSASSILRAPASHIQAHTVSIEASAPAYVHPLPSTVRRPSRGNKIKWGMRWSAAIARHVTTKEARFVSASTTKRATDSVAATDSHAVAVKKEPRVNHRTSSDVTVASNNTASPSRLPVTVKTVTGKVTIMDLGTLVTDPGRQAAWWSNAKSRFIHPYPLGFRSVHYHWGKKFECVVGSRNGLPEFRVFAEDRPKPFTGASPTKAWTKVCLHSHSKGTRLSGPACFGFSSPVTIALLNEMPGWDVLSRDITAEVALDRSPQQVAQEQEGLFGRCFVPSLHGSPAKMNQGVVHPHTCPISERQGVSGDVENEFHFGEIVA